MRKYYVIEHNVPLQDIVWGSAQQAEFEKMKVGSSFLLPTRQAQAIRNAATRYGQETGKRFTIRKLKSGDHRCWRIK